LLPNQLGDPRVECRSKPEPIGADVLQHRDAVLVGRPRQEEARMTAPVVVKRFVAKSHASPDEVRTPPKTRVEIVELDGYTLGRFILEPGWRWSECIKPIVGGESCQLSHAGHVVSGRLTVRLNDGTEKSLAAGESYTIPPGHDAWVDGKDSFVGIEVLSAAQFAKP